MPEAMKLVRTELGKDAIILNSKVIQTGGFLGFFKKRGIEVIAALDSKTPDNVKPEIKVKQNPSIALTDVVIKDKWNDEKKSKASSEQWSEDLNELKELVKIVNSEVQRDGIPLPAPVHELKRLLRKQELHTEVIDDIIKMVLERWYIVGGNKPMEELKKWVREYLIQKISSLPFGGISFNKKFINIVGPTGVGKTTTLAKIAAFCMLQHKKRIAFITTDTYRIAAIEQLKTYANILNVPIEVCYNLHDFQKAQEKLSAYDLVFIDTAGRNFRNQKYVEDLKEIIDFKQEMETLLVLSLTSKQTDMEEIMQQFSLIHIDKLIFTKTDETSTHGAMFNMIYKEKKALAYITNGQNVPDDIDIATPENVINYIVGVD